MDLDALYQEIILDHYKNPHHKGLREPYEAEVHHVNPTCGDEVTMRVHLSGAGEDAVVEDVSYDAEGCSISQAATSVMTDLVIGKPVSEALVKHDAFLELMQSRGALEPDVDRQAYRVPGPCLAAKLERPLRAPHRVDPDLGLPGRPAQVLVLPRLDAGLPDLVAWLVDTRAAVELAL